MYLVVLAIGKNISRNYLTLRPSNIDVFYAGNFEDDKLSYYKEYDSFHKRVNELADVRQYYIKTDILGFFQNINVTGLFSKIDINLQNNYTPLSQKQLLLCRELFLCLGQGEYPLLDNCTTTSFLSTVIYLDETDTNLYEYIEQHEDSINSCYMARYVDDLYIFFDTNLNEKSLKRSVSRILDCYVTELKKVNLTLNRNKSGVKSTSDISADLKNSLYDEIFYGKDFNITDFVDSSKIVAFWADILQAQTDSSFDNPSYNYLILKHFQLQNIESSPGENYNAIVYTKSELFAQKPIVDTIFSALNTDYAFMKVDARRFIAMLTKTKNGNIIKKFLNNLFSAHRDGSWSVYDTALSIYYLLHRSFQHRDILEILKNEDRFVFIYIQHFCLKSFTSIFSKTSNTEKHGFLTGIFHKPDDKLFLLYFLYNIERLKNNQLTAFAYYKNFFDRLSAHIAVKALNDAAKGKPNYKRYYKENVLKNLYSGCEDSDIIITNAHKLRNSNPLSHSSANLVDTKDSTKYINDMIFKLEKLSVEKIRSVLEKNLL